MQFPRTEVGGISVSRMIIGTNWFLGYCHSTASKSRFIQRIVNDRDRVADILEVFLEYGVDTIMCPHTKTCIPDAVEEAQQRTGKRMIVVSTPSFSTTPETPERGFDRDEVKRVLDAEMKKNAVFCLPHQSTTDVMLDKCRRKIRQFDGLCELIREREMIPGLSTHAPESIIYADETGLDVATYIQPFNAMGFLMQVEVDWIARIIQNAAHPVMTIKSMAAGQIRPLQALTFSWNTIRPQDMVTVGTAAPEEVRELCELSLDILSRHPSRQELQKTRSKASLV